MEDHRPLLAICMLGRMGDLISVEPVFRRLAEQHADRKRVWYTTAAFSAIYRKAPFFDEIVEVKDAADYLARKADFPADALIYEFKLKGGTEPPASIAAAPGGQFPLLTGLSGDICPEIAEEGPRFYFDDNVAIPKLPQRYAVFHCASNGRRRQWPGKRWEQLAEQCKEAGLGVVEIGIHPILSAPWVTDCTGKLDLQAAAAIIRRAGLFVGVESGFAHLANAARVFGVIIAGKLEKYPDYNPYTGFYSSAGNGCCMVRYFDEYPFFLPAEPAKTVLKAALSGKPMSYVECQLYCREMQIREMQHHWHHRFFRWFAKPWEQLTLSLLAHRNKNA